MWHVFFTKCCSCLPTIQASFAQSLSDCCHMFKLTSPSHKNFKVLQSCLWHFPSMSSWLSHPIWIDGLIWTACLWCRISFYFLMGLTVLRSLQNLFCGLHINSCLPTTLCWRLFEITFSTNHDWKSEECPVPCSPSS